MRCWQVHISAFPLSFFFICLIIKSVSVTLLFHFSLLKTLPSYIGRLIWSVRCNLTLKPYIIINSCSAIICWIYWQTWSGRPKYSLPALVNFVCLYNSKTNSRDCSVNRRHKKLMTNLTELVCGHVQASLPRRLQAVEWSVAADLPGGHFRSPVWHHHPLHFQLTRRWLRLWRARWDLFDLLLNQTEPLTLNLSLAL